ncbi:hypothetical protein BV898_04467 [Hypsibius exemplaris]|uniref:Protein sleepless n=1 Tax=Hypsibius exemplaris TaxID=2072580 RepID=A0A1W0X252_HYPEX|nr:hypothetical protein BV898_04467 [Hypsibius exemplaris]
MQHRNLLGKGSIAFLATLGILLCLCVFKASGILCYECNSHYDPRCGDHFDNLTYPLTDCRYKLKYHLDPWVGGATMCRKMVIHIHGEKRIVRECAFLGQVGFNDGRWCLERVGTRYIHYSVCQCNNKDGCNAAPSSQIPFSNVLYFLTLTCILHFLC